jgi:hypothetical protein
VVAVYIVVVASNAALVPRRGVRDRVSEGQPQTKGQTLKFTLLDQGDSSGTPQVCITVRSEDGPVFEECVQNEVVSLDAQAPHRSR